MTKAQVINDPEAFGVGPVLAETYLDSGDMGVIICLRQGSLRSVSTSSRFVCLFLNYSFSFGAVHASVEAQADGPQHKP